LTRLLEAGADIATQDHVRLSFSLVRGSD
jgi:hypothetical protein